MRFDSASIRAFDEHSDRIAGYVRQVFPVLFDALGYVFRRLVVEQQLLDRFSELGMLGDRVRSDAFVILPDSGLVLRISRIVQPAFSRLCGQFIRYGALAHSDSVGDFSLGESSANEEVNLMTIATGEPLLLCFFMRQSYQKQEENIKS